MARIAYKLLRGKTSIFTAVAAREIKIGLSVEKVNALNFSSTALFTGGLNRIKFINFYASIILELNLAAAVSAYPEFFIGPVRSVALSKLIVWGLTSRSSSSRESLPLTRLEIQPVVIEVTILLMRERRFIVMKHSRDVHVQFNVSIVWFSNSE